MLHTSYRPSSEDSKESTASLWIRYSFIWVVPLIRSGFSTDFPISDLPDLDEALRGDVAERKLHIAWAKCEIFNNLNLGKLIQPR